MKSRDFCFWLQGYLEINAAGSPKVDMLDASQVDIIQRHLALVFKHEIDPSMGDQGEQDQLNAIHGTRPNVDGLVMRC